MEFLRIKKVSLGLDLAPLIDVVFQLLIFFMLTSSFSNPALRLNLPKAAKQDPREPERVVLSVDKGGRIFLNQTQISREELKPRLAERLAREPRRGVHLRADREMPYRYFVEVMDQVRQAGVQQILIVHESEGQS